MVIFNIASADFLMMSADAILKHDYKIESIEDRATRIITWAHFRTVYMIQPQKVFHFRRFFKTKYQITILNFLT